MAARGGLTRPRLAQSLVGVWRPVPMVRGAGAFAVSAAALTSGIPGGSRLCLGSAAAFALRVSAGAGSGAPCTDSVRPGARRQPPAPRVRGAVPGAATRVGSLGPARRSRGRPRARTDCADRTHPANTPPRANTSERAVVRACQTPWRASCRASRTPRPWRRAARKWRRPVSGVFSRCGYFAPSLSFWGSGQGAGCVGLRRAARGAARRCRVSCGARVSGRTRKLGLSGLRQARPAALRAAAPESLRSSATSMAARRSPTHPAPCSVRCGVRRSSRRRRARYRGRPVVRNSDRISPVPR